jgi:MGT family glycosyltransferase
MTTRPIQYLVALVDGGGTVPPELGAVRRLVQRGHDVVVLSEDSIEDDVRATGASFRPWVHALNRPDRLPENDPYRDWEAKTPPQLFERLLETQFLGPAAGYMADLDATIAERRPDVVLCSQFAFGAMIAAEAAGIPFMVLMPNVYMLPCDGMPPFGLGLRPANGVAGRVRDRIVGGFTRRLWDTKGLARLNALRAGVGLDRVEHFWDQVHHAACEVVMTSAEFDFPANLPPNAGYVGPILDDPTWTEPWSPPAGDDPLVLVALSSMFQDHVGCLQRIVDAMALLPVRAVVTTGPAVRPSDLSGASNVSIVRSAPHRQVLEHAAVVVTHGGHGTVVKSLAAGVPVVVMHHGRDQADNAARVTARGAGIAVKRTAKPAAIARAVRRLLEQPAYAANAERLGEAVRRDAESGALLRLLEAVPDVVGVSR